MKACQQTIKEVEKALGAVVAYYPADKDPVMTDINIMVSPVSGVLSVFNDDGNTIDSRVVEEWRGSSTEGFYENVSAVVRSCIRRLRDDLGATCILQPFSFILVDDRHETIQDLEMIDEEETVTLDSNLLQGFEDDLDDFLLHLLSD